MFSDVTFSARLRREFAPIVLSALLAVGAARAESPVPTSTDLPAAGAEVPAKTDVDTVLRDLAALGPEKLTRRLEELKKQAKSLREESKDQLEAVSTLNREAEALEALTEGVKRLAKATAPGDAPLPLPPMGSPWKRHDIERGPSKSEGIRLGDINGDGLQDLAVGWEGQGVSRIYLNPGPAQVFAPWPSATVATTPDVEDALLVDLDGDGHLDVVSSQEKDSNKEVVAWGPSDLAAQLDPGAWTRAEFSQITGQDMWMYAAPIHLAPGAPVSLVIGGKNYVSDASASLGVLIAPAENPRDLSRWQWRKLANLSWVMSIEVRDLDGDGFEDIVYSDKHGPLAGVHWLKNPGAQAQSEWARTTLTTPEVDGANFLTLADLDQDGLEDILAVVELKRVIGLPDNAHRRVLFFRRTSASGPTYETHEILAPPGIAQPKGITVGDVDRDGHNDIVLTSSGALGNLIGTSWLRYENSPRDSVWKAFNIAGPEGVKYDLVYLQDLDGDGDLDVLANDEKEGGYGLGVFWYENPTISTGIRSELAARAEK